MLMVYYEIRRGLLANDANNIMQSFENLCFELGVIELTLEDTDAAAYIYSEQRGSGRVIEDTDILIAAQCITNNYTLVTNNVQHFKRIDDLQIVNWTE